MVFRPNPRALAARSVRPAFLPSWAWLILAILAAVELLWLWATPLSLAKGASLDLLFLGLGAAALLIIGQRLRRLERFHVIAVGFAWLLLAWPVLRLFNHLTMTIDVPLADARLATWDRLIGFDWFGYLRWVDQHSWLVELMRLSYGGLTGYTCLLFLLLTMTANPMERGRELILLFLATAILCSSLGALFPAIAAAAYFPIPEGSFRWIDPSAGSYHLDMLASLRSDPAHSFALNALPGLVTFPSFHTAMGVLGIYCARGVPLLLGPSVAVNTVMIASTPVFGSHYGVDVLAGAAAAGAVILVHRRLSSGALRLSLNNTCRTRPGWASSPSGEPLPT